MSARSSIVSSHWTIRRVGPCRLCDDQCSTLLIICAHNLSVSRIPPNMLSFCWNNRRVCESNARRGFHSNASCLLFSKTKSSSTFFYVSIVQSLSYINKSSKLIYKISSSGTVPDKSRHTDSVQFSVRLARIFGNIHKRVSTETRSAKYTHERTRAREQQIQNTRWANPYCHMGRAGANYEQVYKVGWTQAMNRPAAHRRRPQIQNDMAPVTLSLSLHTHTHTHTHTTHAQNNNVRIVYDMYSGMSWRL